MLNAPLPPLSTTVTVIAAWPRILTDSGETVIVSPNGTGGGGLPIVKAAPELIVTPVAVLTDAVMVTIRLTAFALNLTVATPALSVTAEPAVTAPAALLLTANDTVTPDMTTFCESVTIASTLTDPEAGMDVTNAEFVTSVKVTVILAGVPAPPQSECLRC